MPKKFIRSTEPLLPPIFKPDEILFFKWLAGFVDGDGYFCFYEKGNKTYLDIKQATWNLHLLEQLKEKFGGSLTKINRGEQSNSYHYRLAKRSNLIQLLHGVNGYIRTTSRTVQFKEFCNLYNVTYIEPNVLTPDDPYLAGMFDADGSVNLYASDTNRRVAISMSSKYINDINVYKGMYGGGVTTRPTRNCSDWQITAQKDVMFAQESLVKKLKSNKLIRFKLIPLFYELKERKAYNKDSPFLKDWEQLVKNWYDNGADIYRKDCTGRPYTQEARQLRALKDDLDE